MPRGQRDANNRRVELRPVVFHRPGSTATIDMVQVTDESNVVLALISADGMIWSRIGFQFPGYTTAQRDALPQRDRPSGLAIWNTDTNLLEINLGTDTAPFWKSVGRLASDVHLAGTLAQRPTPGGVEAGVEYLALDDRGGTLWRNSGTQWVQEACSVADPRLTDQRVPLDGSVTPAKINFGSGIFNFPRLQQGGMDVLRTPYGPNRHIEAGHIAALYLGSSSSAGGSYWYVDPFASINAVVAAVGVGNPPPSRFGVSTPSLTGAGVYSYSDGYPGCYFHFWVMAEGGD